MPTEQYVYIVSNSLYPSDVFKIGSTKENPSTRAYQLQSTGVPVPFTIEYIIVTSNGDKLEKEIHRHLHDYRVNPKREFFKIDKSNLYQILTDEMGLKMIPFSEFHYIPTPSKPTNIPQAEPVVDHVSYRDMSDNYCSICDIRMATKQSFQNHFKTKTHYLKANNEKRAYPCLCSKIYKSRQARYLHRRTCVVYQQYKTGDSAPGDSATGDSAPVDTTSSNPNIDTKYLLERINNLEQKVKIFETSTTFTT